MPKNTVATKSKMRPKSTRRPLRDVSNAGIAVKATDNLKKAAPEDGQRAGGGSLDRLLLVHSDISSLLRQIDELVVQALQQTGNEGRKEIKKFADMLSDMQTSLKPWIPRLQKVLSCGLDENNSEQLEDGSVICVPKGSTDGAVESPIGTKWDSLVSPSPLVSWRAECNTKGGRQLFLLTPLPQTKSFSSKLWASSIPALEMTFEETAQDNLVSLPESVRSVDGNLLEGVSTKKPSIDKGSDNCNHETICGSPPPYSKKDCFVMTPCLKMSPPKSCILLEPMSGFSKKKNLVALHKSTPFPTIVQISDSKDSESSSDQSSDDLKGKYPELFGINLNYLGNKKAAEESPNWIVSPPKTCVIMEPSDEDSKKNLPGNCLPARTSPSHIQEDKSVIQDIRVALDLTERTPMMKEPLSTLRMGKRPGENTLKKELWTKFEAASSHGNICFDPSILDDSSQKGFLDLLEEAFEP